MSNKHTVFLLAIGALLATITSCAPTNISSMREGAGETHTFEVDRNYRQVFDTIKDRARGCYQGVQGDLSPNTTSATVTASFHDWRGPQYLFVIDIVGRGDGKTEVRSYYGGVFSTLPPYNGEVAKRWVTENSSLCGT